MVRRPPTSLSAEDLIEQLNYNPDTGVFTRRHTKYGFHAGSEAGSLTNGYIRICVANRLCSAHRLAWLYMTGEWPKNEIDHINCVKTDNSWRNLREATRSENNRNASKKANVAGYKGVSLCKNGMWRARVCFNRQYYFIGNYASAAEAHSAYVAKAKELFGEFARAA